MVTTERKATFNAQVKAAAQESGLYIARKDELRRDLARAALTMGVQEARYLVDYYYMQQEDRKRAHNQVRSLRPNQEPHAVMAWLALNASMLEDLLREVLGQYANTRAEGRWADSIVGIGPVLSAGLVAHIDITKCRTVSQLWRFAGYDPQQSWLGREGAKALVKEVRQQFADREIPDAAIDALAERSRRNPENLRRLILNDAGAITWASIEKVLAKRPWNASLKTLCVHPDGIVTTRRGPVPIARVVVGDEVLTHRGRWRPVTKVFVNDHLGLLFGLCSANAGNQTAWLTAGHPVLAAPVKTWRSGRTIKANEVTRQPFRWFPVEQVQPRWLLNRPVLVETSPLESILLAGAVEDEDTVAAEGRWSGVAAPRAVRVLKELKVDYDLMRLIGLYIAEGHVSRGYVGWSFHQDERDLLAFVSAMLGRLTDGIPYVTHNASNHAMQVMLGAEPLCELFKRFGTSAHTKCFPGEWLSGPKEILQGLWDGVMQGDGNKDGSRITTVSKTLAYQLVDLGRRLGLSIALHAEPSGRAYRVLVNQRPDENPTARILLETPYCGPVYNLEVADDHSYVVEGFAVHNCWKVGESFVKVSNNEKDFYGHLYAERKKQEEARNQAGQFAAQAAAKLEKFNIGHDTDAYKAYSTGFLPPAHIHSRAERWAVKLFLSHYHAVAYETYHGTPAPKPYVFDHLGHQRFIPIPNWPMP